MSGVFDVLLGISTPLKVAWTVWLAWAAGQAVWFRRGREVVLPPMAPEGRAARKPRPDPAPAAELSEAAPV
jgi:hypothetical protein